jgi:DNA invertase Pin-like site-specific DNA recombinase
MIVGYARVSTDGQTLDAQRATLKAAGVERTYAEKISELRQTVASYS